MPVETADGDVVYWAALVRGRAEDALGHQDKAIEAYRAALAGQPGAQSATAALSVLLLRANKPDEARQLASMAMSRTAVVDRSVVAILGCGQTADHRLDERTCGG